MSAGPSAGASRIELLDAVRGFALVGVLIVNARDLSLYGFLPNEARTMLVTASLDGVLGPIITALVDKKALTIFTLLFGIGFAMQTERSALTLYVRRLVILFAIGVIHGLFFYGDILRYYAVLGLLLIPTARVRPWILATVGLLVAMFPWPTFAQTELWLDEGKVSPLIAFGDAGLSQMLRANWSYDSWLRNADWGFPLALLGRFLVGAAMGRSHVFIEVENYRRFWRNLLIATLPLGLILTGWVWSYADNDLSITADQMLRGATSISLGLGYVAAFVLLFQSLAWRRWLIPLAPFGQMALTNYLLFTFVGLFVFYGVGLGVDPRFGLVGVLSFSLVVSGVQILASRWWLSRFNFGPVEWIWRSLTYGRRLDIRRSVAP